MRYRLLQARLPGDIVRQEEREAFAARLACPVDDVIPFDLLEGGATFDALTDGVDAVLVGGSGEFSINDPHRWMTEFVDGLGALCDARFPTFASCFGFQGIVVALGGTVRPDEDAAEVGTFDIELTEAGLADPLFAGLPRRFPAQLGHKERAIDFPSAVTLLARSDRCAYQALRVGDSPVYATQFHPELSVDDNLARFRRYAKLYAKAFGEERIQEMIDGFQPSPEANGMLATFRDRLRAGTL